MITSNSSSNEKYLVEELEVLYAKEAVIYDNKVYNDWETTCFDPLYYDKLLSGKVFWQFSQLIFERIQHLNKFEVLRFFNLSIAQFLTHTPENRFEEYGIQYHKEYSLFSETELNNAITPLEQTCIEQSWRFYESHFTIYRSATIDAFEEYKSGVLSIQSSQTNSSANPGKNIKIENFNCFTKLLLRNVIYATSPLVYKNKIAAFHRGAKFDIIDNILLLAAEDRKPYLNSLYFNLGEFVKPYYTTSEDVSKCLTRLKINLPENILFVNENNRLHNILSCIPMQVNNKFTGSYNKKWFEIQTLFFEFYYGFYLDDLVKFIDLQMLELTPPQPQPLLQQLQPEPIPHKKLKVNITVPQLTFLFKMLNDLNPAIFDIAAKTELSNFIADNFITKATEKDGIKSGSVYNLLTDTDKKTAIFWSEKLVKMLQEARQV